jgi:hypothetical protein
LLKFYTIKKQRRMNNKTKKRQFKLKIKVEVEATRKK